MGLADAIIAATALVHGLPLMTRSREFSISSFLLGPVRVTGHFKTSQSGSNQNRPLRGA
jgi:hypothetical protein